MALTSEPVVDGGEAELQRMIAEGPHM
jgi:hypothetical protein